MNDDDPPPSNRLDPASAWSALPAHGAKARPAGNGAMPAMAAATSRFNSVGGRAASIRSAADVASSNFSHRLSSRRQAGASLGQGHDLSRLSAMTFWRFSRTFGRRPAFVADGRLDHGSLQELQRIVG